ncbi:MAG: DUF3568 family protein [Phycisphaeraceae bacterium]
MRNQAMRRMNGFLLGVLALLVVLVGCETSQPGVTNALGTVRTTVEASPAAVVRAAEDTLTDMGLTIVTRELADDEGLIVARTEARRQIDVRAERQSEEQTRIAVRAGIGGDEQIGLAVLRRIRARLDEQPAEISDRVEPAEADAEQPAEMGTEMEPEPEPEPEPETEADADAEMDGGK